MAIIESAITLSRLTVNNRLSHETICFSADILLNGKIVGVAENAGHGGETRVHVVNREILPQLEAEAAKFDCDFDDNDGNPVKMDLCTLLQSLAQQQSELKRIAASFRRDFKKHTVIRTADGRTLKLMNANPSDSKVLLAIATRHPGATLLNNIDPDVLAREYYVAGEA
jgi:hypothetical protein